MTIKSHRPLREQMLRHRVHKMIRVSGDTFQAVVNCAVIICQRGAAAHDHTCQMADLTNVSIFEQHERFLHLLYQTEGFARRQNVANQTYAIYHYRQSLIQTNSNIPFFVASPKLFALMRDVGNEIRVADSGLSAVAYNVSLNGRDIRLFKLGDQYTGMGRTRHWLNRGLFQVMSGIKTGGNSKYLRLLSDEAQKTFERLEQGCFLDDDEAIALADEQKLNGITGRRCFVRFEMGCPLTPTAACCLVTTKPHLRSPSTGLAKHTPRCVLKGILIWRIPNTVFALSTNRSRSASRANTVRLSAVRTPPVFLNAAPRIFLRRGFPNAEWLGVLNSKLFRYVARELVNHTVNFGVDDIKEAPVLPRHAGVGTLVAQILRQQERNPRYDYATSEQVEIDRLVYAAYGLNEADIREVEDWYARRYKTLADAQRKKLAAKQGKGGVGGHVSPFTSMAKGRRCLGKGCDMTPSSPPSLGLGCLPFQIGSVGGTARRRVCQPARLLQRRLHTQECRPASIRRKRHS